MPVTPLTSIRIAAAAGLLAFFILSPAQAHAQAVGGPESRTAGRGEPTSIVWEVQNCFRLFRNARDFDKHVAAMRNDGALAAERRLEIDTKGMGWARQMIDRLCLDGSGKLLETCERDGEKESYLTPSDYPIRVTLGGPVPPGATCAWTFKTEQEPAPQELTLGCEEDIKMRAPAGRTIRVIVDMVPKDGPVQHAEDDILVQDLLVAGLGNSIAAGEGNPDKPVGLSDLGFCFRRFLGTSVSQYFRPGRAGYKGDSSCELPTAGAAPGSGTQDWRNLSARWMNAACHSSLYGYQMRTALGLAVENKHIAVTFIPLACSGATITDGLLGSQTARECPLRGRCPGSVPGQIAQLQDILKRAGRTADLLLLTIGANDVQFSGLVGNVIVDGTTERALSKRGGLVVSPDVSDDILKTKLPGAFVRLRAALKPLVGGNLRRVLYVSYGNPALQAPDTPCAGGRDGFDVHPAFNAEPERLRDVATFVSHRFLPVVKSLATCGAGTLCNDPATERMTFADTHQAEFAHHGFCARADTDPVFDRVCFSTKGDSFEKDQVNAPEEPLACEMRPSDYQPYASRARWVRTANDSYFTAMTYPEGLPALLQPRDIHDAMWGIVSAVYGGAIHPTAEGHAAMADAAIPMARAILDLDAPPAVTAQPLPPPIAPQPQTAPPAN